jgi:flavorubredoxin
MQIIRCTKKLQKEMGLKKTDLIEEEPTFSFLGAWHANLIHLDRRKCVLFVNDKTLFNFIAPDVSRDQIRDLANLFKGYLACVLSEENIPEPEKIKVIAEYEKVGYSNTNSKSVLGSMNDLAFHYKYDIQAEGGVHSSSLPSIIKKLNRMPMGALGYKFPIEALKALYAIAT